jgi:hypothetical protein
LEENGTHSGSEIGTKATIEVDSKLKAQETEMEETAEEASVVTVAEEEVQKEDLTKEEVDLEIEMTEEEDVAVATSVAIADLSPISEGITVTTIETTGMREMIEVVVAVSTEEMIEPRTEVMGEAKEIHDKDQTSDSLKEGATDIIIILN